MDLWQVSVTSSSPSQRAWSFHFLHFQCPRVKSAGDNDDDKVNPQHADEVSDAWGAAGVSVGNRSVESSAAFPCICSRGNTMERCKSLSVTWCFVTQTFFSAHSSSPSLWRSCCPHKLFITGRRRKRLGERITLSGKIKMSEDAAVQEMPRLSCNGGI